MGQNQAYGSFEDFIDEVTKAFQDPNRERNEWTEFEKLEYSSNQTMAQFISEYELHAGRARIIEDRLLIHELEKKLPSYILRRVYDGQHIPSRYHLYRDKVIEAYNLEQQIYHIRKERQPSTSSSQSPAQSPSKNKRFTSKKTSTGRRRPGTWRREVKVESQTEDVDKNVCFACKKPGHWKKDCPKLKKVHQLRDLYAQLDDEEKDLMTQDF